MSSSKSNSHSTSNTKTSRIIIPSIRKLTPNFNGCYYILINVNETKVHKTKPFEFKSPSNCEINQSFPLDPSVSTIDKITFELHEKGTLITSLICKGEVTRNKQTKDEFTNNFICYLINNNNENCMMLYYNLEFIGENIFQSFTTTANALTKTNASTSWLTSIAHNSKNNNDIHMLFIHNLEYIRRVITEIEGIIKWKQQHWKSIFFLLINTFILLQSKTCFVFILPLLLILMQAYYSKHIDKVFINANTNSTNNKLFYALLNAYNSIIYTYEYCVHKCLNGNKRFVYELYLNIFKLFIMNIIVFYTPLFHFVSVRNILLLFIWGITLSYNTYVCTAYEFITRVIKNTLFSLVNKSNTVHTWYMHVVHLVQMAIPFYSLYVFIKQQEEKDVITQGQIFSFRSNDVTTTNVNDISIKRSRQRKLSGSDSTKKHMNEMISRSDSKRSTMGINQSGIKRLIKVELYENERWWVFVGWTKNVVMNEVPLWCKVSEPHLYCDKPGIETKYDWISEWKVETHDTTDEEGWEYSIDFNSLFSKSNVGKYVRRRKWVRYAN